MPISIGDLNLPLRGAPGWNVNLRGAFGLVLDTSNAQEATIDDLKLQVAGLGGALTTGITAVSYGDSITAANKYQPYVTDRLVLRSYVNRGVSGRPMADGTANGAGTVTTVLSNGDHASFRLVTIAAGTNDFRLDVPIGTLGTWASALNRNTYLGAYRTALDFILKENPRARIVLCTPLKRNNAGYTDESTNAAGHKLADYAQAVRDVARMYGLPVCDWYLDSGFNERTLATLTTDGLHPNALGNSHLGRFMGDFLGSVLGIAPPVTLVSDAFTRADVVSPLGVADTGQTWTVNTTDGATWGVVSGQAYQSAAGSGFAAIDGGERNVTVRATLGAAPTVTTGGIAAWITNHDNGVYLLASPTNYQLARRAAGANTNLNTLAQAPVAGDVLELVTAGTVIKAYVNGVQVGNHPNLTSPARTSNVGFWGSGTGGPRFESVTVTA